MRLEIALNIHETLQKVLRIGSIASNNQIDRVWVVDFPGTRLSPVVAAALAEEEITCRIGLGLLSPLLYDAAQMIRFVSTLASKYGDRFDLLIGPGDRGMLNRIGIPFKTRGLLDKIGRFVDELRTGFERLGLNSSVFVGAQGPKMIALAMSADGVLLNYTSPQMISWAVSLLTDAPDNFQVGIFPPTKITDVNCREDPSFMYSAAVIALGLTKSVATRFNMLEKIAPAKEMLKRQGGITQEVVDLIPEDVLTQFGFCGNEKEVVKYVDEISKIGVDMIVFGPPVGSSKTQTERLVKALSMNLQC